MQPAETQARGSSGAESRIQLYGWDSRTESLERADRIELLPPGVPAPSASAAGHAGPLVVRPCELRGSGRNADPVLQPHPRPVRLRGRHDLLQRFADRSGRNRGGHPTGAACAPEARFRLRVRGVRAVPGRPQRGRRFDRSRSDGGRHSGTPFSEALVFSISTGLWTSDLDYVLSGCVEKIALSMLEWVAGG